MQRAQIAYLLFGTLSLAPLQQEPEPTETAVLDVMMRLQHWDVEVGVTALAISVGD